MSAESQPLLSISATGNSVLQKNSRDYCGLKYLCLPSKSAILLILWTIMVGTTCTFLTGIIEVISISNFHSNVLNKLDIRLIGSIPQAMLAAIMILYPFSGFLADVCCERFRTVFISTCFILLSLVLSSCISVICSINEHRCWWNHMELQESITVIFLFIVILLLFTIGLAGYQANFIQLGLDQLLEAPSEYLGLFAHWAMWAFNLTFIILNVLVNLRICLPKQRAKVDISVTSIFFVLTLTFLGLLVVSRWKHQWFYREPGQDNPYKTVFKVLNFARKHRHPLQRSAFTYSDNYIPSRIDFAKERYGGPFTTEQVENVKTLLRLLLLLFTLAPTYVLQVPASLNIFTTFGYHLSYVHYRHHDDCTTEQLWSLVVESGGLTALISNILFPLYIWLMYSVCRRKPLKMLTRLKLGIILCLLGVFSMLITDLVGHSVYTDHTSNTTETLCMFKLTEKNYRREHKPLKMHWTVLLPPSVFLSIGPLLVTATTLEFISAQSPYSMKGLLVGMSFAIQGFSQLIGYLVILPVSLAKSWTDVTISCGFIYLLIICIIGLGGLILFSLVARKYKYRKRDDENFSQREVEEVYSRYLTQAERAAANESDYDDDNSI